MTSIEFKYLYEIPQRKVIQVTYPITDGSTEDIECLMITTINELRYLFEPFTFEECIRKAYQISKTPSINVYFDRYSNDYNPWVLQKITICNDNETLYRRFIPFLDDWQSLFGDHNTIPEINPHLGVKKDDRNKRKYRRYRR